MKEGYQPWTEYRPRKDPYIAARALESLPRLTGQRGEFIIRLFSYFRWVDDQVDERDDLTKEQKLDFIERQMSVVQGNLPINPLPMEKVFDQLPWDSVPAKEIRHNSQILLASISQDAFYQGFKARTDKEITEYNLQTVVPVINMLFLALNGKTPGVNHTLMQLLSAYITIGSLEGLGDDLSHSIVKLPIQTENNRNTTIGEVLTKYDQKKFNKIKWRQLVTIVRNIHSFAQLDIPIWQKAACMSYIAGDVLIKKSLFVRWEKALKKLVQ